MHQAEEQVLRLCTGRQMPAVRHPTFLIFITRVQLGIERHICEDVERLEPIGRVLDVNSMKKHHENPPSMKSKTLPTQLFQSLDKKHAWFLAIHKRAREQLVLVGTPTSGFWPRLTAQLACVC